MNAKQITAIVVVVGLLAVGIVGAGYAYQASYTDQATGDGTVTASYFKIAEGSDGAPGAIDALPSTDQTYALVAGTATTQGATAYTYKWLAKNGAESVTDVKIMTGTTAGTAFKAYKVSNLTDSQASDSMTVKLYFFAGEFVVSAPEGLTQKSTITVTADQGAAVTGTIAPTVKYCIEAYDKDITAAAVEGKTYSASSAATVTTPEAVNEYKAAVYVEAEYTIAATSMGTGASPAAITLNMPDIALTLTAVPYTSPSP